MNQRYPVLMISSIIQLIGLSAPVLAVPTVERQLVEDQPEEVLRAEIILDARSPVDGKPMSAAEYAQLQAESQAAYIPPEEVPPKLKSMVGLLKLRKFIKTVLPFIPIK
jgi:hypothetical protein